MSKTKWLLLLITSIIALVIGGAFLGYQSHFAVTAIRTPLKKSSDSETLMRSIHANQKMIARFQGEFGLLLSEHETNPTEKNFIRLQNLKNKIAVLIQENARFLDALSKEK